MKILYIYREKEKKEHSIEAVFDTVSTFLEKQGYEIQKWYKPVSWKKTFKDIWQLRKENFDIYHITGDVNYLWLFFPWKKTTMTCHDIGMYKNNNKTFIHYMYVLISFILSSVFLRKITAVSELTKNDLVNILHINPDKIHIIHNPISMPVLYKHKNFNKKYPTILQIGTGWHKNLEGLIEAAKNICCKIQIIGVPSDKEQQKMKDYGIDFSYCHHISTEEVVKLYEQCDILYFVSYSEGFGMPIIEAQTVGRVVMTTDTEPTKSVAGEGALLFSPNDYKSMHNGLLTLINNDELRESLISRGRINAIKYSPERIGNQYKDFYIENFIGNK